MKFSSITVPLKSLVLDIDNPRFVIPVNANQSDIINYLLEYEEVAPLAEGIVNSGGLLPGEKPIVCLENGHYIVLEGNRRICACKLLSDRKLIPEKFSYIKFADETLLNTLSNISVDIVDDRDSVQSTLYNRHIQGIKDWKPIAKQKFYAKSFLEGKTIENISKITSTPTTRVIKGIQQYRMLERVRSLSLWTSNERLKLNNVNIEVDPFMRVFNSKSARYDISVKKLLKVYYDEKYYPHSTYGDIVFDKVLYLLAKNAFLETDKNKKLTTRKHIEHIPELVTFLVDNRIFSDDLQAQNLAAVTVPPASPPTAGRPNNNSSNSNENPPLESANTEIIQTSALQVSPQNNKSDIPPFFGSLTWNGLNPKNQEEQGIFNLAKEIRSISTNRDYKKYPIAAAILLRALFEQSLKHLIKKSDKWDELISFCKKKNSAHDPMLGELINFLNHNNNFQLFINNKAIQSSYKYSIRSENIVFFDTIAHNSFAILPTLPSLEEKADGGMRALINYILNL